ncbi:MAG: SDR family NAD(P)-dependent oxidoreductase [Dehalococcoidia bacterium]
MSRNILITGGAGFIGSHLADELIARGCHVRVLDNLSEQVHGPAPGRPEYLHPEAELFVGDVTEPADVRRAVNGMDAVYHLAAKVGVGQSMYEIAEYTRVNNLGTAVLLEALAAHPVERFVVASSMSIYGEGLYCTRDGGTREVAARPREQLAAGEWEVMDSEGNALVPVPTPETKTPTLASIYALSKYDQEKMCLMIGESYQIPTVALRFFNVYGTRQSLSNPYTGVLAIFASRLLNDNSPLIYEDGNQQRDFVNVRDVVQACCCAINAPGAVNNVFNIGSGNSYTVRAIAEHLSSVLNKQHIQPKVTSKYRVGDIRHCFADISKAKDVLGYAPEVTLEEGMRALSGWLEGQVARDDADKAAAELSARKLTL